MTAPVQYSAVEAERGVLGSILLDAGRVLAICDREGVADTSFAVSPHPDIFRAALAVRAAGASVDLLTLTARLRESGRLEEIGGAAFLESLVDGTPTAAHAEYYVAMLRAAQDRRRLADWHRRAGERIGKADTAPGMLAGEFSRELADAGRTLTGPDLPEVVSAADWLATPPPAVDEIVEGLFETGDKVAIIGPSKMRKSFLTLQLALSVASGRDFLGWRVPKPRDVLLVQFEVKGAHYHRRLRHVAEAAQLDPGNRLQIVNGRGRGLTVAAVQRIAERRRPALVIFDPLFRLVTGEENAAEGMKPVLLAFDALAETCGAAVTYVHHDGKGDPAERDIRDRGAGSGVLGRDYDAGLTLTQHRDVPDAVVLATLTRNYPPAPAAVIQWQAGRFVRVDGVAAVAGRPGRYDDAIRDFLRANPGASVKVISEAVGCDPSTASRVRARLRGIA